ncbi:nitroreductase/quinone reductase family protein [Rhodococcus sp. NPDC059968]|uniref:nitroreductase/quinone reductase family protein n=1 Tax=Rhodococcus sp. NPDC059968 TaxID=3347017 RepID=UPI00366D6CA5
MNASTLRALHLDRNSTADDRTIDITTTGARSGRPHRQEIWFYRAFDTIYLTGRPGPRDWYANIVRTPTLTLHIREPTAVDIHATGRVITDATQRRRIFGAIIDGLLHSPNLALEGPTPTVDTWLTGSPLVEVQICSSS